MKPIIILPPDEMSEDDIKLLRENGLCVVVSKNPTAVKFVDPIPSVTSRTQIEDAAIRLSRRLLKGDLFRDNRRDFANLYVDCLIKGTPLDPEPTQQEKERDYFSHEKLQELSRLAKEEARAERLEAKKTKAPVTK